MIYAYKLFNIYFYVRIDFSSLRAYNLFMVSKTANQFIHSIIKRYTTMKQQTKNTINTATLLPVAKVAKKTPKTKAMPVYEHEQGDCIVPNEVVARHDYLSLVGLPHITSAPLAVHDIQLKAHHIDKVKLSNAVISNGLQLNLVKPKQTIKTPQTARSGAYVGKVYNRPVNEGACLSIWEWMDRHPKASKKELIAALPQINKITCGVQFKHWCDSVGRDSKAA